MKLAEYKNEDALDLMADLLEPVATILADQEFVGLAQKNVSKIELIKHVMKKHGKEIIAILARIDGVPVKDYTIGALEIPKRLLEIINDPEMASFFQSQGQTVVGVHSGSVTENIEATGAE